MTAYPDRCYPDSGKGKWVVGKEAAMGQFENILIETLVITTQLGIPVAILFLIGYLLRIRHLPD